jgi:hypothetical protein
MQVKSIAAYIYGSVALSSLLTVTDHITVLCTTPCITHHTHNICTYMYTYISDSSVRTHIMSHSTIHMT